MQPVHTQALRVSVFVFIVLICLTLFSLTPAMALEPSQILVVANLRAKSSRALALHYMQQRGIPEENLVLLAVTDKETCLRQAYETQVLPDIRGALAFNPSIRAIVTMYGVPLRIASPGLTPDEQKDLDALFAQKDKLEAQAEKDSTDPSKAKQDPLNQDSLKKINKKIKNFKTRTDKTASLDSELMLVKVNGYPLNFWLPNPYYPAWAHQKIGLKKSDVLMVSRLDGANEQTVKRIIEDSLFAEKMGLSGIAYFDARWKKPVNPKKLSGYRLYDYSIHNAAERMSDTNKMIVKLNDEQALFKKGDCPDAALYCGWYSLANYVDAFTWKRGSVGFHIASAECRTLKKENSNVWCKKMLDKGIAATVGPVGEPYVQSFPMPEIFFELVAQGKFTLAECYLFSLPFVSWKMVLIGDPLYRVNIK